MTTFFPDFLDPYVQTNFDPFMQMGGAWAPGKILEHTFIYHLHNESKLVQVMTFYSLIMRKALPNLLFL